MNKILVEAITDTSIRVGKKVVYLDCNDNWVAVSELTTLEKEAFNDYIIEIIATRNFVNELLA